MQFSWRGIAIWNGYSHRRIIPAMAATLKDSYHRPIRDLRVSLTDRCNFRCFYCLPHGEPPIARSSRSSR